MSESAATGPGGAASDRTLPVEPMPLASAWVWFGVPGIVLFGFVHAGIPALERLGLDALEAYLIALLVPLAAMTAASLILLRREGRTLSWSSVRDRYRFRGMTVRDWAWACAAVAIGLGGMMVLGALVSWLVSAGVVPLPDRLPAALDPRSPGVEGLAASIPGGLFGRWDLVALYFAVLFFNVVGEESFWRGYVLPRQEAAHGHHAWAVHGTLWAVFHVFKWWEIIALLPLTLALAYVCQRRRNSTPGLVIHAAVNGGGFLGFTMLVAGLVGQ